MSEDSAATAAPAVPDDVMLTTQDVAAMFQVDPRTVSRWARRGLLPPAMVTPGGVRRWSSQAVAQALAAATAAAAVLDRPGSE